jgi:hypothetical protein
MKWSELSIGQGGLGLGQTTVTKHAAFAASFGTVFKTIEKHVPDAQALLDTGAIPYMADVQRSLVYIRTTGGFLSDANVKHLLTEHEGNCHKLQELLAQSMLSKIYTTYRDAPDLPINEKAWLTSTAQYEGSLWLEAIPKSPDTTFTDEEYRMALHYRYMLPQPIIPDGTRCTCATRPTLDRLGHHAMTGCKCGGGRQNTHDLVKHVITYACRYALVRTREEEIGLFRTTDPGTSKRPDITVESGPLYSQHAILDVAVTCPIPGGAGGNPVGLNRAQAGVQGRAAALTVQRKVGKYGALATGNQLHFIPMVFESTGYVHDLACAFMDKVADYAEQVKLVPKAAVYKYWMTRISVVLQKGLNAALVRRVAAAVNKSGGYGVGQAAVDVLDQTAVFVDRNMH